MKHRLTLAVLVFGFLIGSTPALARYTLIQDGNTWDITPVEVTGKTATDVYSYGNPHRWSGNNENFEHLVSKLYLYGDPDGTMNLVMHHSMRNRIDDPKVWIPVAFGFSGVPAGTEVALADDSGEMNLNGGRWRFHNNSDGGILTKLDTTTNWCLTITPNFLLPEFELTQDVRVAPEDRIRSWQYLDAEGKPIRLDMTQEAQICHTVPAPGAFLLSALGTACIGWVRKRRA